MHNTDEQHSNQGNQGKHGASRGRRRKPPPLAPKHLEKMHPPDVSMKDLEHKDGNVFRRLTNNGGPAFESFDFDLTESQKIKQREPMISHIATVTEAASLEPEMRPPEFSPPEKLAQKNDPFWMRRRFTRDDSFPELEDAFMLPPPGKRVNQSQKVVVQESNHADSTDFTKLNTNFSPIITSPSPNIDAKSTKGMNKSNKFAVESGNKVKRPEKSSGDEVNQQLQKLKLRDNSNKHPNVEQMQFDSSMSKKKKKKKKVHGHSHKHKNNEQVDVTEMPPNLQKFMKKEQEPELPPRPVKKQQNSQKPQPPLQFLID